MEKREVLERVTRLYYPSTFKIFDIDSGGYFISLGITTSRASLEKLGNVIRNSEFSYEVHVAELESECLGDKLFSNRIIGLDDAVSSYKSDGRGLVVLGTREEAYSYLDTISGDYSRYSRIIDLIRRIELQYGNDWESYRILLSDCPVIYYNDINYKKDEESNLEYRIGLYIA